MVAMIACVSGRMRVVRVMIMAVTVAMMVMAVIVTMIAVALRHVR